MANDWTAVKPALVLVSPEQVETVFADFAKIAKIDGFPACGPALSQALWHQAIAFDKLHHPDVMAGGCWMNHGFSTDNALPAWAVLPCPVTYREDN